MDKRTALEKLKQGAKMIMEHDFFREKTYLLTCSGKKCFIAVGVYDSLRKRCNTESWGKDKIIKIIKKEELNMAFNCTGCDIMPACLKYNSEEEGNLKSVCLRDEAKKNKDLKCFHECPNCRGRCNCSESPCVYCKEEDNLFNKRGGK